MESSRTVYYLYRYLPVVVGLGILSFASVHFLYPELFTHESGHAINYHSSTSGETNLTTYIIAGVIGFACVMAPLFYQHRIVVVRLTDEKIFILQSGDPLEYDWKDVTQLMLYRTYRPTLYKLRVKGDSDYFLFSTGYSVETLGGRSYKRNFEFFVIRSGDDRFFDEEEDNNFILADTSEMGQLIERKKRELKL